MDYKNKSLAHKITIELLSLTGIIIVAVLIFSAFFLKGSLDTNSMYKMALVGLIVAISIGYTSFRVINSYVNPIKFITNNLLDFKSEKQPEFIVKGNDALEIINLHKALKLFKENYQNYQDKLREEVWNRTMELEDYKNHLEQMVEEQLKDIRLAKFEAERANKAKTEFLANMSHEFRTPMHAIISFSSLGLEKGLDIKAEKALKYFESINISGKRLMELLNDLLDLSKLESGVMTLKIENNDFLSTIEQVLTEVSSLITNKNIAVIKNVTSKHTILNIDNLRITQVVMNLFSNAIKFSPDNSKISYEVADYTNENGQQFLKFSIIDSGIGIPEDELETIFDKFVQSSKTRTGAGGTGLGLSICKLIIENHGGKIWAERKSPPGAQFTFLIPRFVH